MSNLYATGSSPSNEVTFKHCSEKWRKYAQGYLEPTVQDVYTIHLGPDVGYFNKNLIDMSEINGFNLFSVALWLGDDECLMKVFKKGHVSGDAMLYCVLLLKCKSTVTKQKYTVLLEDDSVVD